MESFGTLLSNEVFDNNGTDFLKLGPEDFGRESLMVGKESLGILKLNELDITLNDYGRESLGIIDIEKLNISAHNSAGFLNSPLNTAFLYPNSYGQPFPSTSTNSGDISFHSASLNGSEISKIYSVQSSNFGLNDTLNEAFGSGGSLLKRFSKHCQIASDLNDINSKDEDKELHSLSQIPNIKSCDDDIPKEQLRRCVSEGGSTNAETNKELRNLSIIEDQGSSDDFVFIEASYLAMKIQDISFVDEADDLFNIDKTSPPKELDLEEVAEDNIIHPPLNIFKSIDIMVPPKLIMDQNSPTKTEYKSCENLLNSSIKLTPNNDKNLVVSSQTLPKKRRSCGMQGIELGSDINQNDLKRDKVMTRSMSDGHISTNPNLKEVRSILFNLSNIISNELEDDKQKEESKHLLSSLADILLSKSDDSKDSNHSDNTSLEKNGKDSSKKKSESSQEPLDLSIKSVEPEKKKTLKSILSSPKIAIPKILGHTKQYDKPTVIKNEDNGTKLKKLKPKKVESGIKKGPLKAMIPLGSMAKSNGPPDKFTSPTHVSNSKSTGNVLNKRTSTPISEKNIKPLAQSTPESNSFGKMKKCNIPSSPLARTSGLVRPSVLAGMRKAFNNSKQNSGSAPSLSESVNENETRNTSMERRHSESELKKPIGSRLKRSFSAAQETNPSVLTKMKQNITKTRHGSLEGYSSKLTLKNPSKNSDIVNEGNPLKARNRILSNIKPTNLISKINSKQGKENKC